MNTPTATPGIYTFNGKIYVVKSNKDHTRCYAKQLVPIQSTRLTVAGDVVDFEFVYAPGAIYKLTETNRMSVDEALQLTLKYGRCLVCGRKLKVAKSVLAGMGPVCRKLFPACP